MPMMDGQKDGHDEEDQAFLSTGAPLYENRGQQRPFKYLRLILECAMAVIILALLVRPPSFSCGRNGSRRTPVPEFLRKTYEFVPNRRYLHEDMFQSNHTTLVTLHNWIELSAAARGYIQVPNPGSYDLGEPYSVMVDRRTEGPAYMMSVFHQLHCLSYLVEHFQQGFGGVELTKEIAHHSAHCFDYIRQAVMCAADTTLEGLSEAGAGWGSKHECKDYSAVLEWANKHGTMAWPNELMPAESTL